ncbi:hypothetical protein [Pantoea sp. R13S299]|uniref:hypothetical protein n=1 Tax=Pantoea sp. R13S299 TaxID=3402751 RepID=UPI003AE68C05
MMIFCVLCWILVFSVLNHALAADQYHKNNDGYGDVPPEELVQKIKRLDLTEQQRNFLESLLQTDEAADQKSD